MKAADRILVLGIGNMLWADEGFGIRVVEALDRDFALPDHVGVMDGGTQGLYLLPHIENLDALIIVDAIDYGLEPGAFRTLRGGDVPAFLGAHKMSLHQTGFQDVLATAQLLGRCPRDLVLIGVQPAVLDDYGGGLTDIVAARVQPAVDAVLRVLGDDYGIAAVRRGAARPGLVDARLSREAYEAGRPSAEAACRIGDPRVLGLGA
ncbi:HyaD/HybD family hydrogenase maturation endopeptidase [Zavarzinia compransoris]|uniref:Hydrogenase expression/formation protein HupD n=1 Tax=Zavarzinia compransoris TaxID=1264899 RepID=A0A317E7V2_9PROT|nr:HyaD/HybD family hydrogenase maturation endopeptidase [Zavarzinia compransoris]PWR23147.1 hydrogenase expression/formation protein [Zavarzinia compransoris]TDP46296.1 hydrogenase 1 maturation peptidase HyaD [Zavarzinia compransoris]